MIDITQRLNKYRECVKNLWNTNYFEPWMKEENIADLADEFEDICVMIFSSLILNPLGAYNYKKSVPYKPSHIPIECLVVTPLEPSAPIYINREVKHSGYCDYPIDFIRPIDVKLNFIDCFDFDIYSVRDFEYYLVRIVDSSLDVNLIGRDALIEPKHVKVYYTGDLEFDYRCSCQRR